MLLDKLWVRFLVFRHMVKDSIKEKVTDENGEVNIVVIVVLIGIAIILALIFKDKIIELLETLFGNINQKATDAVTGGQTGAVAGE